MVCLAECNCISLQSQVWKREFGFCRHCRQGSSLVQGKFSSSVFSTHDDQSPSFLGCVLRCFCSLPATNLPVNRRTACLTEMPGKKSCPWQHHSSSESAIAVSHGAFLLILQIRMDMHQAARSWMSVALPQRAGRCASTCLHNLPSCMFGRICNTLPADLAIASATAIDCCSLLHAGTWMHQPQHWPVCMGLNVTSICPRSPWCSAQWTMQRK